MNETSLMTKANWEWCKMTENDLKWPKMTQNDLNQHKMKKIDINVQNEKMSWMSWITQDEVNDLKWQIELNWLKMTKSDAN